MKPSKIKICFIISGLGIGGAEKMLIKLIAGMRADVFQISIISMTNNLFSIEEFDRLGINLYCLNMNKNVFDIFKLLKLIYLLKFINPDIVHTWMYHADLLAGLVAKALGFKKIVWSIRQSDLSPIHSKQSTINIVKICVKLSHYIPIGIISCSHRAKDVHIGLGYKQDIIEVIPNGFDLSIYYPRFEEKENIRSKLKIPNNCLVVGFFARFDEQKNHLGFLDTLSEIISAIPSARFLFAGHGIDLNNNHLKKSIIRNNLSDYVYLLGIRSDIPQLLASLDVLVLPSSYGEAFPNIIGEAMACGIPCIVTDVGDSKFIVNNNELVAEAGDMRKFKDNLIKYLIKSPEEKYLEGIKARKRVVENYDIREIIHLYEQYYKKLAGI